MIDIDAWAEDNGSYGRCPACNRRIWVESACVAECDSCGWSEQPDEAQEEPETLAGVGMCEADFL